MMTKDCPVGWPCFKRRVVLIGSVTATVFVAAFSLLTLGVFAMSVRGNGRGGLQLANPIERCAIGSSRRWPCKEKSFRASSAASRPK